MYERKKNGQWSISAWATIDGKRKRIYRTYTPDPELSLKAQQREARRIEIQLEEDIDNGTYDKQTGETITLRSFARTWLDTVIKPSRSPVTYFDYQYLLNARILPDLGDTPLTDLSVARLQQWVSDLSQTHCRTRLGETDEVISASTVQHYTKLITSILDSAVRFGYLKTNPMQKVETPKARKPRQHCLDEERAVDLLRCLQHEPNYCYRLALMLALVCGLRLGEVTALRLCNVDFKRCTIDISLAHKYTPIHGSFNGPPKTQAGVRIITLPAGLMAMLDIEAKHQNECRRLLGDDWHNDGWIVHAWNGTQMHKDTPSKWFRRFADKHGFSDICFHELRHSHASILLANNVDVVAVAARMGHEDVRTTLDTYAHALASRDKASAAVFDRLMQDADREQA